MRRHAVCREIAAHDLGHTGGAPRGIDAFRGDELTAQRDELLARRIDLGANRGGEICDACVRHFAHLVPLTPALLT
jgi:hypothetical protein